MKIQKLLLLLLFVLCFTIVQSGCNFVTHRTLSTGEVLDSLNEDPEPNYDASLDFTYQDFVSYLFIGNRVENFTAYFNTFYKANEDFDEAMQEYRASFILNFNKRLDSLNQLPPVSGSVKEKLDKSIERSSKIIQFHKNSKFIDKAVMLIGKSYYYLGDYFNAERKFSEFLSKLSSSTLADEALLYLGRTNIRLGKKDEGILIFKNLSLNSSDNEIKSLASRELGVNAYGRGQFAEAIQYFKASNDYTGNSEVKAEGQFILAKIISYYKPELAAKEYLKALDHTSDFDLSFFARLNYAKGLIHNNDFITAAETLTDLRKKYRDVPEYTQLIDLEVANNFYGRKDYKEAKNKYYEVIVKYPNTQVSSDAYYFLAKHDEEVEKNYLNALVNYKKAVEENAGSDYFRESSNKAETFDRYFLLKGDISGDTIKVNIPTSNADVERYRKIYNEEKGIESLQNNTPKGNEETREREEGEQRGDGKGKPGGYNTRFSISDSLKEGELPPAPIDPTMNPVDSNRNIPPLKGRNEMRVDTMEIKGKDRVSTEDSLENLNLSQEEKIFNAYYELAELFMYNLERNDSAEFYLKILLSKYPEPNKQSKVLYTLGNFYKNVNKKNESEETFKQIISKYPNTVYAYESKKILGLTTNETDIQQDPVDLVFNNALKLFNENKYSEAILLLKEIENQYPQDSLVPKSYYTIGWIYENSLFNNDSSLIYYKKLKAKYPRSEYTMKISPMLDYVASIETNKKSDTTNRSDTTNKITSPPDTTSAETKINEGKTDEEKAVDEAGPEKSGNEKVNQDTTGENRLTKEEIEKLLRESEEGK